MKTFLVGIDGSKRAPAVLAQATQLARAFGAKLYVLRVVGVPVEFSSEAVFSGINLQDELFKAAKAELAAATAGLAPDIVAGADVELGTPWDGICRKAKSIGADCIVIGSHGYGGLDRLLGTTAGKVANHAECSVYVVRNNKA